jgi:hypothetical protein
MLRNLKNNNLRSDSGFRMSMKIVAPDVTGARAGYEIVAATFRASRFESVENRAD